MEFDFTWLLWGLPLAFALGWLASRFDLRQWRLEGRQAPRAYFRGLNHLLNEQQDQAIDAFIEAVQHDPDTSELHFALGNLFRRRGDYDRAVRVHEHLLARGDLPARDRDRAQHALAQDFLKAGLLDRAEAALLLLAGTAFEAEAQLALLAIYERSRDWEKAATTAARLEGSAQGTFRLRLAHYRCEQAQQLRAQGHTTEALAMLETLVQQVPESARAWIVLADMRQSLGHTAGGLEALEALGRHAPQHLPLVAHNLVQWARVCQTTDRATQLLLDYRQSHLPSLDVTQALASLQTDPGAGRQLYLEHLQQEPSLVAAGFWLSGSGFGQTEAEQLVKQAIDRASEPLKRYRCAACGFEARQYFWHCPGCQGWDTYPPKRVEEL
ncbi:lipopolysaccharide assembly protein LapB [Aquabacterium sp. A08]|uniref:lipopolysaccharide assembly protein LapB n=1 Tax=Aquabacterium sp. A08 TaxID=2718532 RepID=UPI00142047BE|nr:lipopolysaccharide assembly protein LapB [Aquabacterium sp. A08]NIC40315.1 lipopolysaccharide assembly protein LapB [Aquabacterium sp. A08]